MTTVINIACLVLYLVASFAMERYFARIRNRMLDARDACLRAEFRVILAETRIEDIALLRAEFRRMVYGEPKRAQLS